MNDDGSKTPYKKQLSEKTGLTRQSDLTSSLTNQDSQGKTSLHLSIGKKKNNLQLTRHSTFNNRTNKVMNNDDLMISPKS